MAITRVQTFAVTWKTAGTGSTVTHTMASVPTAGNLLVACLASGDTGATQITITSFDDNIGDGVPWTESTLNPQGLTVSSKTKYRMYYKVVGTPSGGLKDVQCTITSIQALVLFVGEYGVDSGVPTWSVTGSQIAANGVSPTFPADAGDITTTIPDAVLVGFSGCQGSNWNAGSGYTRQATSTEWAQDSVEDRIVSSTGTYAVDWVTGASPNNWVAMGIAFGATDGGSPTSYYLSDTVEM